MQLNNNLKVSFEVEKAYHQAEAIIAYPTRYTYGGGHPGFEPSTPPGSKEPAGYDCSGFASAVLHAGNLLGSKIALDTTEFLTWGEEGEGQLLTLWVRDDNVQHHCFLEFKKRANPNHTYCEAPHTGENCWWLTKETVTGFKPRHQRNT
jgi:hypothetical protein